MKKMSKIEVQQKAVKAALEQRLKNREKYYENPNKCSECNCELIFEKKNNKFCSSSCSAKYNNKKRGKRSEETKSKISKKLTGRKLSDSHKKKVVEILIKSKKKGNYFLKNIEEYKKNPKLCKICNCIIDYENKHRKTCSNSCRVIASTNRSYRNGSRKTIYYKGVVLESSWELKLAKWLDFNEIEWERPKSIKWNDKEKIRHYYPDFYLPKYNLYLDPKNPYCMKVDERKMKIIEKMVKIIYGDIEEVIAKLASVV